MTQGKKVLITGGLGFIGLNAVEHFSRHNSVHVVDDGSRIGCETHKAFLESKGVQFSQIDISHMPSLRQVYNAFAPDVVLHLAAQVAVTLSIANPVRDFLSNAQGTINLLELSRRAQPQPVFLFASTNKVYGQAEVENIVLKGGRYCLAQQDGFDEKTPLSFHTPYGCSKGAADQYVLDYARTFGLPAVSLRQSCIYGPYQYGFEDQGWVAWFAIAAALGKPLVVYGDGRQVRDILYIDDLMRAYECCIENISQVQGEAFNIGGGPANTLSINELIGLIQEKTGRPLPVTYTDWRQGDQKVFICDIRKAQGLGWQPKVGVQEGLARLMGWVQQQKETIGQIYASERHMGKRYDLSIVVPVKNEEDSLPAFLDELKVFLESAPYKTEVIMVNDRSTDRSAQIAGRYPFVKVVDNHFNPGKGGALRCGFEQAVGEYIVMMDADFSHQVSDLSYMVEEVRRHRGLVVASRITGGSEEYTRVRALGNIVLTWFFGFIHGRYLSDALNGFKVFHKDIFQKFVYTSDAFEIEIELLVNALRLGRPITEVPSHERSRLGGKHKSSVVKHGTLFMCRILYEKFRKPASHH